MTQVFKNTEWTDFLWDDHQSIEKSAERAVKRGVQEVAEKFEDFGDELFYRMYSKDVQKEDEVPGGSEWAEKLHDAVEEVGEYKTLKEFCQGEDWKSGIASTAIIEELVNTVSRGEREDEQSSDKTEYELTSEEKKEFILHVKNRDWGFTEEDQASGLSQWIQEVRNKKQTQHGKKSENTPVFKDVDPLKKMVNYLENQLNSRGVSKNQRKEIQKDLDQAKAELATQVQENQKNAENLDMAQIRTAVRDATEKANEQIQEIENAMSGLGCGNTSHVDVKGSQAAKKLMQALRDNPKLRRILELAGRLKRLAQKKQKEKKRDGTNEYTGILAGDEISRLLASESVLLMDPDFELVFGRKFQEKSLLQYELKGKESSQQGPIVMLLDCSYSMGGIRYEWATAVALAFLSVAREQKRDFALIHFSEVVRKTTIFEAKAPICLDSLLDTVTSCGPSGGTNFNKPLAAGLDLISKKSEFEKADLILVTDGEAPVSDDALKAIDMCKNGVGLSCYSILIGSEPQTSTVDKFSDRTVQLDDVLKDEHKMHSLFGEV
jgi:uncharacterized protein with von Willebrand factor type A (vWA) domain